MKKITAIILTVLFCSTLCHAQWAQERENLPESMKFTPVKLAVPATLIAAGTTMICLPQFQNDVKDFFQNLSGGKSCPVDNVLQYAPLAAYWVFQNRQDGLDFMDRTIVLGTSAIMTAVTVGSLKLIVGELRPNGASNTSFPSGHTATVFLGAELVRLEFGNGYGAVAYAVATGVGVLRMYNNWHWIGDVAAGAGFGILCANAGYWLLPYSSAILRPGRIKTDIKMTVTPVVAEPIPTLSLSYSF